MPTPVMRWLLIASSCLASPLLAQEADLDEPRDRRLTVMAGLGNTFAGFGGTVDYWFSPRVSVVGGLGTGLDTGVEAALGVRLFSPAPRHRAFVEAVYAPMAVSLGPGSETARYGPGVSAGYAYTSDGGFSALFGLGVGVATAIDAVELMANLGFGYTWRR